MRNKISVTLSGSDPVFRLCLYSHSPMGRTS